MDETGHNADLRFIHCDNAWAVRPNQTDIFTMERAFHLNHVVDRNAFGNADDQLHTGIGCFQDRIGAKGRRYEDERSVALGLLHRIPHRIEDRNTLDFLPRLTRRHASHNLRPISYALSSMERTLLARNPLHHHPGILINEYAHSSPLLSPPPHPS